MPIFRSTLLILLATIHFVCFAVAGIYSSRVLDMETDVLLRPKTCNAAYNLTYTRSDTGSWGDYDTEGPAMYRSSALVLKSSDYVLNCQGQDHQMDCDPLGRQMATWTETNGTGIPCPFKAGMCVNNTVLRMDSGIIDSRLLLGINSDERVGMRKVVECAPIETDAYTIGWAQANDFVDVVPASYYNESFALFRSGSLLIYNYGAGILVGDQPAAFENASYILNNVSLYSDSDYNAGLRFSQPDFKMHTMVGYLRVSREENSDFEPIEPLNRTDADVSLFMVSTSTHYNYPVNDPWFLATNQVSLEVILGGGTGYHNTRVGNTIGCTEQYQLCADNTNTSCTSLTGLSELFEKKAPLLASSMSKTKQSILTRVLKAMTCLSFQETALYLQRPILMSKIAIPTSTSPPVPDNQWMLEFKHFFATSLVAFQQLALNYLSEPLDSPLLNHTQPIPADAAWMCRNQIVRRKGYSSFSILGLSIILVIGGIFIIVSLTLESIATWLGKRWPRFQIVEWQLTSYLQLQRMAFEGRGRGTWSGLVDEVPITLPGEAFEALVIDGLSVKEGGSDSDAPSAASASQQRHSWG